MSLISQLVMPLYAEVGVLATVLEQLRQQMSDPPSVKQANILETVSCCTCPAVAAIVYPELQNQLRSKTTSIVAFRALMIYPMTDGEESWPMLQWKESDGREVMAIFDVDDVVKLYANDDYEGCSHEEYTCLGKQANIEG